MSPSTCQSLAILDIVSLNCDRHGGNFLVRDNGDAAELVPIDHGLTFPGPEGLKTIRRLGNLHNATMGLPGAYQPFGEEMLAKVDQIDPEAIAAAMRREQAQLAAAHPELAGAISDDAITMSERSARFLKLAAPELPPALCQFAIGRNAKRLFDLTLSAEDFAEVAEAVIAEVKAQQATISEYFLMSASQREALNAKATELGWQVERASADLPSDPVKLLAIVRGGIRFPDGERDPTTRPVDVDAYSLAAKDEMLAILPRTPWSETEIPVQREALTAWREWQQLGGTPELLEAAEATLFKGPGLERARVDVTVAAMFMRQHDALLAQLRQVPPDSFGARISREVEHLRANAALLAPEQRAGVLWQLEVMEHAAQGQVPKPDQEQQQQALKRLALTIDEAVQRQLVAKCEQAMAEAPTPNTRELIELRALNAGKVGQFAECVANLRKYAPQLVD